MAVLLGLPWLAAVLGSLFTGVVGWLAAYVTKRLAIAIAAIAALVTLTGAFVVTVEGVIGALSYTFPVAANFGFMLPPDLPGLVGSYAALRLAYWVYSWNVKVVQLRMF